MGEEPVIIVSRDRQAFGKTYRSYLRAGRWSRLAFVALGIVVAVFLVWATPWFSVGMTAGDYSPPVIIAFLLLGLCPVLIAVAILLRGASKQRREALGAWLSIYDKTSGLRNQDHFFERLRLQCQMGRQMGEYGVGVVLINVEEKGRDGDGRAPAEETLHLFGSSIAGEMRPTDLVAYELLNEAVAPTAEATGKIRRYLRSRDLHGTVSVEQGSLSRLPYVSSLADTSVDFLERLKNLDGATDSPSNSAGSFNTRLEHLRSQRDSHEARICSHAGSRNER